MSCSTTASHASNGASSVGTGWGATMLVPAAGDSSVSLVNAAAGPATAGVRSEFTLTRPAASSPGMTRVPMMLIEPPQLASVLIDTVLIDTCLLTPRLAFASETTPGRPGEPSPVHQSRLYAIMTEPRLQGDEALPKRPQYRPA